MGKAIFIGLGGAGVYPTGHLKAKMLFNFYKGDAAKLAADCQFIFIDTDDDAVNKLNEEYGKGLRGGRDFITYDERVNLGDVNPFMTYWRIASSEGNLDAPQQRFLSWVDRDAAKDLKDQKLEKGASANRQQGRIAIWAKRNDIEGKIRSAMRILDTISSRELTSANPTFYILSGTCGGTGSSAFLDVAYILDRYYRSSAQGTPNTRAVLFMPYWYIEYYKAAKVHPTVIENYQCNPYAFFDEIEALLSDQVVARDGTKFRFAAVPDSTREEPFPVFRLGFCVDSQTERGFSMTQAQMYRNTAELLYYWHLGSAQDSMISKRDNEETPVVRPGDAVPRFATIGYRALQFPADLMEEYFKKRFLYELFEHGVLGERYADAVPDERERNDQVQRIFRKCISRYLFASDREENVPNLETERRVKVQTRLEFFDLGRFKRDGKDAIDPNKVANSDLLDQLLEDADAIARQVRDEMKREFEEIGGTTSLENVMRTVRDGYREATGKFGSLEDEIEDAILRYGLKYAHALAGRLDTICEEQVQRRGSNSDLLHRTDLNNRRLKELEGEVAGARKRCQEVKSGKREEALWELYGKLRERIEKRSEQAVLEQQIDVLNRLSEGEHGIIDDIEKGIADLIVRTQDRIEDKENGLKGSYKIDLPGRFVATDKDVTTTYLPPVMQFVEQGEWARGHLFDVLYRTIVEHEKAAGGSEKPRRFGSDFGYASTRKGLHGILWEMLAQRTYADFEYEVDGHTTFFRRAFNQNPPDTSPAELLTELETIANRYVEMKANGQDEIRNERDKSLFDRFNAIERDEDKKWILEQFSAVGTQTFCPMEGEEGTVYSVYAGPDEALAVALGYRPADEGTHQFVKDESGNRLVRIKMLTQQTLRRYPHYKELRTIYYSVKERRSRERTLFAPHIHKVFNKVGAQRGLAQVAADRPEQRLHLFASMILFREMCDKAFKDKKSLLGQVLDIDEIHRGAEKRNPSLLLIGKGLDGQPMARACVKLERSPEGKVRLLERNYETISHNATNFYLIWLDMQNNTAAFSTCAEFEDHFRLTATSDWIFLLGTAKSSLDQKITRILETLGNVSPGLEVDILEEFHNDLSNELLKLTDDTSPESLRLALAGKGAPPDTRGTGSLDRSSMRPQALSLDLPM